MRKWLIASVLAFAGIGMTSNRASAAWWDYHPRIQPNYATVAFPMQTPSGYFTNAYYFAWYYPWYQNYNYSHGHYANWWMAGGYASYAGQSMHPVQHWTPGQRPTHILPPPKKESKEPAKKEPGMVSIQLPADAKLLFNGVVAGGKGESRTFVTPDLNPDQDYEYVLTAEVIRDRQPMTVTEYVIIRAGETTTVTLTPTAAAAK